MVQSNPDGTPLRQSIVESKEQEFTKGDDHTKFVEQEML